MGGRGHSDNSEGSEVSEGTEKAGSDGSEGSEASEKRYESTRYPVELTDIGQMGNPLLGPLSSTFDI